MKYRTFQLTALHCTAAAWSFKVWEIEKGNVVVVVGRSVVVACVFFPLASRRYTTTRAPRHHGTTAIIIIRLSLSPFLSHSHAAIKHTAESHGGTRREESPLSLARSLGFGRRAPYYTVRLCPARWHSPPLLLSLLSLRKMIVVVHCSTSPHLHLRRCCCCCCYMQSANLIVCCS